MPIYPELYESDDVTLAQDLVITVDPGADSTVYEYAFWNDNGGGSGDAETIQNARIRLYASDGVKYVRSGEPVVDEMWGRITVIGVDNTGDDTMPEYTTDTIPIGASADVPLPDIPPNCAIRFQFQLKVPGDAPGGSVLLRLRVIYSVSSMPLARKSGLLGTGVYPSYREPGLRRLLVGRRIGTDDTDAITVSAGSFAYDGSVHTEIIDTHTLNQNDVTPAALASGESYYATISQPETGPSTVTKGTKAVSPTKPAVPTGELLIGYVLVAYDVGGSAIGSDDVDETNVIRGDYLVESVTGLTIRIGAGIGVVADQETWKNASTEVDLTASETNRVWLLPDGSIDTGITAVPPTVGSSLLYEVETNATDVLTINDVRVKLDPPVLDYVMRFRDSEALSQITTPLEAFAWDVLPFEAELVKVGLDLQATDGTWTAGQIQIDVRYYDPGAAVPGGSGDGATVFTSNATEDHRPLIAYNATDLRAETELHEVRRFAAGTRFVGDIIDVPSAPGAEDPEEIIISLYFRRYR